MDEATARDIYWSAVEKLNELIRAGERTSEDILEELDNDLEA